MVGNVILQCEDVANLTIVALGPQVTPRQTVDKLRIDPHALASPLNTALEHIAPPRSSATCCTFTVLPLYVKAELRAMTKRFEILDRAVMIVSVVPSLR